VTATGRAVAGIHGRRHRAGATGRASRRAVAAALGLLADRALGEPPTAVHPVARFGRVMAGLEHTVRGETGRCAGRIAGAGYAGAGAGLGWAAGCALGSSLPAGVAATWLVVAGRALGEEATAIGERLAADDLDGARRRLPALVGRDPDSLDAKGVARAVVESVAENTVDAVVAPACWAAALGAPGAGLYRAVNTLDAMVGYHGEYEWLGKASARLDDALNWVPARLTAWLLIAAGALVRLDARGAARVLARDGARTESPNAGRPMAAMAGLLRVELAKQDQYRLGDALEALEPAHVGRAWRVARLAACIALAGTAALAEVHLAFAP